MMIMQSLKERKKKRENYISRMDKYFTSNRLKSNTDKTKILISTPDMSNVDGNLNMKVNGSIEEKSHKFF